MTIQNVEIFLVFFQSKTVQRKLLEKINPESFQGNRIAVAKLAGFGVAK
jgi:hypothetical protein